MANITSNLAATITAVDVDTKQPVTRDIGSPSFAGKTGEYTGFREITGTVAVTLPVSPALCVWVRNRAAAGTITVIQTPQGGVAATVIALEPGASHLFWNPTTSATAGITALSLTASAAAMPVEYYIGG